jgi:hypothetical protein
MIILPPFCDQILIGILSTSYEIISRPVGIINAHLSHFISPFVSKGYKLWEEKKGGSPVFLTQKSLDISLRGR